MADERKQGLVIPQWAVGLVAGLVASAVSLVSTWSVRANDIENIKDSMKITTDKNANQDVRIENTDRSVAVLSSKIDALYESQRTMQTDIKEILKVVKS